MKRSPWGVFVTSLAALPALAAPAARDRVITVPFIESVR
jgi:hypothetical protein